MAATAAIAPLAAAVSPAPAALTALTPPSAAVNPTRGRQAIPTLCDSVDARARSRAGHAFRQFLERVTLTRGSISHVAPEKARCS